MDALVNKMKTEHKVIKAIRDIILQEYQRLRTESKNYKELEKKCKKRFEEIIYRDVNIGAFVKGIFEQELKKELGNIKCHPEEN